MLRPIIIAVLIVFILAVGLQLFLVFRQSRELQSELSQLKEKADFFQNENKELKSQMEFLSRLENLGKEMRAKFNLKNPDEQMMIVVP